MNKKTAIKHFGSVAKMADAIGVTRQAIYQWPEQIPEPYAWTVQGVTDGKLRVDTRKYRK